MSLYGALDQTNHLSEFTVPLDTQRGVLTPAQRKALAVFNLGLTATNGGAFSPTLGVAGAGGVAISPRLMHTGANPASAAADFTDQTPVATEVYIAEVYVPANASLTGVALMNGSAVSGNVKVGLANSAGLIVATSASTAQAGTTAYQRVPFTAPFAAIGPGTYYVTTIIDNATGRLKAHTVGNFGASKQTGQVFATGFTTITPPTTFTTALGPVATLY